MSLRVWLPFTDGTLRQQGLSNETATSGGTINLTNTGKLGKCATFGSAAGGITIPASTMTSFTNCSVAFWLKINGWGSSYDTYFQAGTGSTPWNNYIFGFLRNNTNSTICFTISNGSSASNANYLTSALSINTWYHIVLTYETGKCKIYLNGTLDHEYSTTIVPAFNKITKITLGRCNNDSSYQTQCSINDFRIYDHCLSPMEVKELSKGLVLHYPLNRQGWGQENLLKYTKVNATNQNLLKTNVTSSWNNLTLTTKDGYDCYLYPSAQSSTWFASGRWYSDMKANTTYTYTAWIYFTANASFTFTSLGHFQVYNSASTASDKAHEDVVSARIYEPSTIVANTWTKVRITFTTNNLANSYFVIYPRYNIGANVGDLYFRDCKLEESSVPTPWCPHSVDNEYTTMGLNSTIEYDCSGFCNNGTRTGTFEWSSDTPKYSVSTHIGTTSSKIHITGLTTSGFGNSYSFAWWGKRNSNSPMFWGFENGIRLNGMYQGNLWNTGDGSENPIYKPGTTTTITVPTLNVWHHYVMTGDGTACKLYLDGELYGQAKIYKAISGTSLWINGWNSATSYASNNTSMSDFRIYATALSASDVKSLYQNSAYIDSSGNVYGAVHSEV